MKLQILTLITAMFFVLTVFSGTYAQENNNLNVPNPQIDQGQGGGQTFSDDASDFSWWWLLPLIIAVPVLYMIFSGPRSTRIEKHETSTHTGRNDDHLHEDHL